MFMKKITRIICQLLFLEKHGTLFGIFSWFDPSSRMLLSLQSESTKSEDVYAQLPEIQESVRVAFLNCLVEFAGMKDNKLSVVALSISSIFHINSN